VPRGPEETALQALGAASRAYADGLTRQRMELLLPLIGATDLDDWYAAFLVTLEINFYYTTARSSCIFTHY
jgi:hypothetical protein